MKHEQDENIPLTASIKEKIYFSIPIFVQTYFSILKYLGVTRLDQRIKRLRVKFFKELLCIKIVWANGPI